MSERLVTGHIFLSLFFFNRKLQSFPTAIRIFLSIQEYLRDLVVLSVSFGKANALENAFSLVVPGDSVRIWGTTFGLAEASTTGGSGRRRDIHHCITLREF